MKSIKTSEYRKLSIYGFQVSENSHNFYALLEFDVSGVRRKLRERRQEGKEGSLFAFFLKAFAECLKTYPLFNSMIDLRKTTTFSDVDLSVPIEVVDGDEIFNKQLVIRNAEKKSISEIEREINESKNSSSKEKSYLPSPLMQKIMCSLPSFLIKVFFRTVMRNHELVKKLSGTVFVTSVSMFTTIPGFIIPYIGKLKASSFAVGTVCKKPAVKKNEIVISEIVNITAVFNHDIVDGAPAARFMNRLRSLIETEYEKLLD